MQRVSQRGYSLFRDTFTRPRRQGLCLCLLFTLMTACGSPHRESPCLRQVNDNGFGDDWNCYAWSMAPFGDHLYVGTLNANLWGDPIGAIDAANLMDAVSKGTEIWRFDGHNWEQVVDNGFKGNGNNAGTRNLFEYKGMLYAGTVNYAEGCEVWRTADGETWEPIMQGGFGSQLSGSVRGMAKYKNLLYVGVENVFEGAQLYTWDGASWTKIANGGIGNPLNFSVADMLVWKGLLYLFTWNALGLEIYTYDGSTFECICGVGGPNPPGLSQTTNMGVMGVAIFNDRLYLGTADLLFGADLFRTDDGKNWVQLINNGFSDQRQAYIWRMKEYRGDLYMGTFHEGHFPLFLHEGGRLYRMDPQERFEELVGPDGLLMDEGFGDWMNYGMRTLSVFNEKLYIGTAQFFLSPWQRKGLEIWEFDPDAQGRSLKTSDGRSVE